MSIPNAHDFPGNSNEKKTRPRVESVIKSTPLVKEPSLGNRIKETFTVEGTRSVFDYLLFEVVIPNVKALILDSVTQGMERKFYGEDLGSRSRSSFSSGPGRDYIPYNRMYKKSGQQATQMDRRDISRQAKASHNFSEVVFANRGEAEKVLDALRRQIAEYDVVTVYDFYDMINIRGDFPDEKYGWTDLRGSSVRRVRDGYSIALPSPLAID